MNYLPEGYEELKTNSSYLSFSKLPEGDHRFRLVQRPVAGWIDWKDNKPYRYRPNKRPDASFDAEKPMRAFWACYVWDYAQQGLYVVEITQASIMKSLTKFGEDDDWGDFTKYDIKIHKKGTGKETSYLVSPAPHKEMSEEMVKAIKASPVSLENLYNGGDPWSDVAEESNHGITTKEADYLEELLNTQPDLRTNILTFLNEKGCGSRLIDMPSAMYDKIVDRVLKAIDESKAHESKQRESNTSLINAVMPAEDALPF